MRRTKQLAERIEKLEESLRGCPTGNGLFFSLDGQILDPFEMPPEPGIRFARLLQAIPIQCIVDERHRRKTAFLEDVDPSLDAECMSSRETSQPQSWLETPDMLIGEGQRATNTSAPVIDDESTDRGFPDVRKILELVPPKAYSSWARCSLPLSKTTDDASSAEQTLENEEPG